MSIKEKQDNLELWSKVCKTDPAMTKKISGGSLSGMNSLPGTYVLQMATEVWGPMGTTWRFDILEERFDEGGPIGVYPPPTGDMEHDTQLQKVIFGKSHTIKLRLYYQIGEEGVTDKTPFVEAFGHTPYLHYNRKYSEFQFDEEAPKKSYTDAQKKCLSQLGFSADVYLGFFENPEYLAKRTQEARIEKAADAQMEMEKQQQEFQLWYSDHIALLKSASNMNELTKLFKIMLSRVNAEQDSEKQKELIREKDTRKTYLEKMGEQQKEPANVE